MIGEQDVHHPLEIYRELFGEALITLCHEWAQQRKRVSASVRLDELRVEADRLQNLLVKLDRMHCHLSREYQMLWDTARHSLDRLNLPTPSKDNKLHTLVYRSHVSDQLNPENLEPLMNQARRYNDLNRITGVLIFDAPCFFQILEGDRQQLFDLYYGDIRRDSRHTDIKLLLDEPIGSRAFLNWGSGYRTYNTTSATKTAQLNDTLYPNNMANPSSQRLLSQFCHEQAQNVQWRESLTSTLSLPTAHTQTAKQKIAC